MRRRRRRRRPAAAVSTSAMHSPQSNMDSLVYCGLPLPQWIPMSIIDRSKTMDSYTSTINGHSRPPWNYLRLPGPLRTSASIMDIHVRHGLSYPPRTRGPPWIPTSNLDSRSAVDKDGHVHCDRLPCPAWIPKSIIDSQSQVQYGFPYPQWTPNSTVDSHVHH